MKLTHEQKVAIVDNMTAYLNEKGMSQAKFADLAGVPKEYISSLRNGKFEVKSGNSKTTAIADQHFMAIDRFLNTDSGIVKNANYVNMCKLFAYCKKYSKFRIIDGKTGSGKSFTSEVFQKLNPENTYLVKCADDFSSKEFLEELALTVGTSTVGTKSKLRRSIVHKLSKEREVLIIIDEAENLKDNVYGSLKAIADEGQGKFGVVLVGANKDRFSSYYKWLQKKATELRGCFPQMFSRFKTEPVFLEGMHLDDAIKLLAAQGLETSEAAKILERSDNMRDASELVAQIASKLV